MTVPSATRCALVAVAGFVFGAAGCSTSGGGDLAATPADSLVAEPEVTLGLASAYDLLLPLLPEMAYFVDRVEELSGGEITVEPVYFRDPPFEMDKPADAERLVVEAVAAGDVDLGWAGTRIFDTMGVTSFQAMHAPFLVDSYPLQAAIIDSGIPGRVLSTLDGLGVTGLALLAGGLRIPVAVEAPLLGLDDYEGIVFQYYESDTQAATVQALGAVPSNDRTGRDSGLLAGDIHGHEHMLIAYVPRSHFRLAPHATVNVAFWAETKVLIANPDSLAALTDAHADVLRQAASDAAARSAEMHDIEAELIAEGCEAGARFALASDADLAGLRETVQPVYDQIGADPLTAELVAEIESLKESIDVEPLVVPDDCGGDSE